MARITKYDLVREKSANYNVLSNMAMNNPAKIADVLINAVNVNKYAVEHFSVFVLDSKTKISGYYDLTSGTLDCSIVHPREVFAAALVTPGAAGVIVSHNHPSGDTTPSDDDIKLTKRLIECGKILGIPVLDHIITGEDEYTSLRESGYCEF